VLTILGHRLEGRITVEQDIAEPDELECMPGLLNQALLNLVSNAIDAISGSGTLRIGAGLQEDGYVIRIEDSGHGIPEAKRSRVFEPFFTTKPVGEGTGLGLSITYSIVKKHGGSLDLVDAPDGGTVAMMRLPLRPSERGRDDLPPRERPG
jgi:two-component system NtrC family sensor kinase